MYKLTPGVVYELHDHILELTGGLEGVKSHTQLESIIYSPLNRLHYEGDLTVSEISAQYCYSIARNHCFNDANKRTAYFCSAAFLHVNGYALDIDDAVEEIMTDIATDKFSVFDIVHIFDIKTDGVCFEEMLEAKEVSLELCYDFLQEKLPVLERLSKI